MDHGEGKWTVDDKFSNAYTGSIEKQLRVLNSRFEQLLTQKPESMPPDLSNPGVPTFVRKEDHKLSAINENEQPLLRTREYGKPPPREMNREEAQPLLRTREYGTAPPKEVVRVHTEKLERISKSVTVPKLILPPRKRSQSMSGLVTSNDFFIPAPLSSTSHLSSGRVSPVAETPRKEVLPDSLRGQYTPRDSTKGGADVGREGIFAGSLLGRAAKVRDRCANSRLQNSSSRQNGGNRATTDLERKLQEQGMSPVYCPDTPIREMDTRCGNIAKMLSDLRVFLVRPVPPNWGPVECHIRRFVHTKWWLPSYVLYLSDGDQFLLASKKKTKSKSSYAISLDENDTSRESGNYFGKLRSNFVGSEFWFYDKGIRPIHGACANGALARNPTVKTRVEMGAVKYHYNVLGLGGPRRMTAILPAPQDDGKPYVFLPSSISHNGPAILDHYKNGRQRDKMIVLHSKQPHFNKKLAAYCLNFHGRVTRPSVKNFQLVADSDKDSVVLQFGKVCRWAEIFSAWTTGTRCLPYKHLRFASQAWIPSLLVNDGTPEPTCTKTGWGVISSSYLVMDLLLPNYLAPSSRSSC